MASPERQETLRNAVEFLSDPKTQASSVTQRMQFLEAKGLSPSEIEEAFRLSTARHNTTMVPYAHAAPYLPYRPPGEVQPWDWRDYFIMAIASGSFVYGAVTLFRKFLSPHLQPPSLTAYEADRDNLTAQFDAAEALLKEIQSETVSIRQVVDEQKDKVEQATQDVQAVVKDMREGEKKSRDEIREIRDEVNSIREMLPKMIEKNKESQTQSLAELQQELKSLKALLLSRGSSYSSPAPGLPSIGRPSIPAWQLSTNTTNESSSGTATPHPTPVTAVPVAVDEKRDEKP